MTAEKQQQQLSKSDIDPSGTGLSHLFATVFLHSFATFMVLPAITDVTMLALCPGQDECSFAIYVTGFQQAVIGVGTLVMTPLIGKLSDTYGRKLLLTVPLSLTIIPSAILSCNRSTNFFYAYYVLKTLTAMLSEGTVPCIALAYIADNVAQSRRATVFGILTGITSAAFVCGNLCTRFLSTSSTFQVSTAVAVMALVYMRVFLSESINVKDVRIDLRTKLIAEPESQCKSESSITRQFSRGVPSFKDTVHLFNSSKIFSQAVVVAFFNNLGDTGLHTSLMFFLKACFHFNKDQFADLMVIIGITGTASQLMLMPMLIPALGEEKLLSVALFFNCTHMILYSIAWSSWVPYAAVSFCLFTFFANPCLRSITSKQVGPNEQGKAQGCISGICSFANVMSPLAFSPLTALFLSKEAPFDFPGFSIMCVSFASMIALIQSLAIKVPPTSLSGYQNASCSVVVE